MTALILYACLVAEPSSCRKERLVGFGLACIAGALTAAEWSEEHPGWYIAKWRCGR